nr:SLF8a protein [Citrus maxima]
MAKSNGNLPEDIMIEILSRLSVKSLLRFKCVCRDWCALFENPSFISKHLRNDDYDRLFVSYMVTNETDDYSYPTDSLRLFPDETLTDISLIDIDFQQPMREFLGGPFDGIFCIHGPIDDRLILCNLATKESRTLPKRRVVFPRFCSISCTIVGFGLDIISNDYKLVMIHTLWNEKRQDLYEFSHVTMYNLRTNCWRDFQSFKSDHYATRVWSGSFYLDGICYWLSRFRNSDHPVILSFHLGNDVFEEIEEPCIPESGTRILGIYNHSLSLLLSHNIENYYDIWVMKDKCWIKQLSIGHLVGVQRPLGFWKNGAFFVLSTNEQLLLYDSNTKEMRDLGVTSFGVSVHIYKESLIRLKHEDNLLDFEIPWHVLGVYQTNSCSQ